MKLRRGKRILHLQDINSIKVKLKDGKRIDLSNLNSIVPFTCLFYSNGFTEFCKQYSDKFEDENINNIYLNFLVLKSNKLKFKYALKCIFDLGLISKEEFSRVDEQLKFDDNNLLDGVSKHKLLLKYLVHKIYRLFLIRKLNKKEIVRSWVDVTERLYNIYDREVKVFTYPFSINYSRLFKYYLKLYKENVDFSLMGLPYNFKSLVKCYISGNDFNKIKFEYDAYSKHEKEFQDAEIVYTSDDIEPGSFVLNQKLRKRGVKVINKAHGVGTYSPIVSYDSFTLYNSKQKKFYASNSDVDEYKYFSIEENTNGSIILCNKEIVFLDQGEFGGSYEGKLQGKIYSILNNVSCCRIILKPHPNRGLKSIKKLFSDYSNFIEYNNENKNVIYMHMYSTSYYDFDGGNADFIFIHDDLFDPAIIFGDNINKVHVDYLEEYLSEKQ